MKWAALFHFRFTIFHWIVLGIIALIAVVLVLLSLTVLVVSRIERILFGPNLNELRPPETMPPHPPAVKEALQLGLTLIWQGRCKDSSLTSGPAWILASPDQTFFMAAGKSTFALCSQLRSGVWIATRQVISIPARCPRRVLLDAIQTSQFIDTLDLHRLRIRDISTDLVRLDIHNPIPLLEQARLAAYQDLVDDGLAVWTNLQQTTLRLTWSGSLQATLQTLQLPLLVKRHMDRAVEISNARPTLPPIAIATAVQTSPAAS
jgi:hypothetical protein